MKTYRTNPLENSIRRLHSLQACDPAIRRMREFGTIQKAWAGALPHEMNWFAQTVYLPKLKPVLFSACKRVVCATFRRMNRRVLADHLAKTTLHNFEEFRKYYKKISRRKYDYTVSNLVSAISSLARENISLDPTREVNDAVYILYYQDVDHRRVSIANLIRRAYPKPPVKELVAEIAKRDKRVRDRRV